MTDPQAAELKRGRLYRFCTNPWVGGIGSVCSIIGIPLSIVLTVWFLGKRELAYLPPLNATTIFQNRKTSGFSVMHNGVEFKEPISAVQVKVWSSGTMPIKVDNIIAPIAVKLTPSCKILDVAIRSISRDSIKFKYLTDKFAEGEVPIEWAILEEGDGAVLQITYVGPPEVSLSLLGEIEGKNPIRMVTRLTEKEREALGVNLACAAMMLAFVAILSTTNVIRKKAKARPPRHSLDQGTARDERTALLLDYVIPVAIATFFVVWIFICVHLYRTWPEKPPF